MGKTTLPLYEPAFILVSVIILLVIARFLIKKEERRIDYLSIFILGLIGLLVGLATDSPGYWIFGLIFFIISLANISKWERSKLKSSASIHRDIMIGLLIVIIILILLKFGLGW